MPVIVKTGPDGQPTAFNWQSVHYRISVNGRRRPAPRWSDSEIAVKRVHVRVLTADQQIVELCRGNAYGSGWVLDICPD